MFKFEKKDKNMLNFDSYNKYKLFLERSVAVTGTLDESASQDEDKDALLQQTKDDVERCAALIMGKYKFFGEFIYRFRFIYTYRVPTMATDGANIFINPKFCSTLTDKQIVFILCHEILHNVLIHFTREKAKGVSPNQHERWNYAADYELNPMLVEEGLLSASELKNDIKGLYEEKYLEKTAEEIFDILKDENPPPMEWPAEIGDFVKSKDDKYGKIVAINLDGTYEIEEVTKEEAINGAKSK